MMDLQRGTAEGSKGSLCLRHHQHWGGKGKQRMGIHRDCGPVSVLAPKQRTKCSRERWDCSKSTRRMKRCLDLEIRAVRLWLSNRYLEVLSRKLCCEEGYPCEAKNKLSQWLQTEPGSHAQSHASYFFFFFVTRFPFCSGWTLSCGKGTRISSLSITGLKACCTVTEPPG